MFIIYMFGKCQSTISSDPKNVLKNFIDKAADLYDSGEIIKDFDYSNVMNLDFKVYEKPEEYSQKAEYLLNLSKKCIQILFKFLKLSNKLSKDFAGNSIPEPRGNFLNYCDYKFIVTTNKQFFVRKIKTIEYDSIPSDSTNYEYLIIRGKKVEFNKKDVLTQNARCYLLNHPAVLRVIGWFLKKNKLYYVYPFIGSTLESFLSENFPISVEKAKQLLLKIIYGMIFIHYKGFTTHCDQIFMKGEQPVFGFLNAHEKGLSEENETSKLNDFEFLAKKFLKICESLNEENEENEDKNRSAYASFVFTISQKFSAEKVILKDIADEINSY